MSHVLHCLRFANEHDWLHYHYCAIFHHFLSYLVTSANYDYFPTQERQRKLAEDQMNIVQQQAQAKAQMLRYEDELARKRMQVLEVASFFYYILGILKIP